MTAKVSPVLGNWYKRLDKDYEFQVVAYDETDGVVEIQHYDGDVEALELDDWYEMELEHIDPPEDWAGEAGDFENDDSEYAENDMSDEDWNEDPSAWNEGRSPREED